jgi:hypothetical protein
MFLVFSSNVASGKSPPEALRQAFEFWGNAGCRKPLEKLIHETGLSKWIWRKQLGLEKIYVLSLYDRSTFQWGTLQFSKDGDAFFKIHKQGQIITTQISRNCSSGKLVTQSDARTSTHSDVIGAEKDFQGPTLFYSWSPSMPLSMLAMKDVVEIASANGVMVVLVSDPALHSKSFEELKSQFELDYKKKNKNAKYRWLEGGNAAALFARGLRTHYPSLLFSNTGFIQDSSLPGHKTKDVWDQWLKQQIEISKKD